MECLEKRGGGAQHSRLAIEGVSVGTDSSRRRKTSHSLSVSVSLSVPVSPSLSLSLSMSRGAASFIVSRATLMAASDRHHLAYRP